MPFSTLSIDLTPHLDNRSSSSSATIYPSNQSEHPSSFTAAVSKSSSSKFLLLPSFIHLTACLDNYSSSTLHPLPRSTNPLSSLAIRSTSSPSQHLPSLVFVYSNSHSDNRSSSASATNRGSSQSTNALSSTGNRFISSTSQYAMHTVYSHPCPLI